MAKSCSNIIIAWLLAIWVALFFAAFILSASDAELHYQLTWAPDAVVRSGDCTVAECLASGDGEEFQLDSEIHRRVLYPNQLFIGYAALSRGNVPCSHRGASYYNCHPAAVANTYSRGCSAITRCRTT